MSRIFKIASVLLTYPTPELQAAAPELRAAIAAEAGLPAALRAAVDALVGTIADRDIYAAQEDYVLLFDRTRSLSLNLFEHVHGESRDRGQAMVDLLGMYEAAGFVLGARELPDHLPAFLEYLSTRSAAEATELAGGIGHIVEALHERLITRNSPYAAIFAALIAAGATAEDREAVAMVMGLPDDDPTDLAALDQVWEEDAVRFAGAAAGEGDCGPDRLRRRLRAAARPAGDPVPADAGAEEVS
ncbi:MAG: nitrate reductase molybdenum cofactor assembly chaperone [Tistrella sp.]|uniref:nitrate reductase molybdenum cofactor assembly chaperone n=1 Tax=Tistrella sp. TaxID=2024861 RepID=UPI000C4853A0|nr:nitrate reductase molybdenum cofactor assembly chaperone [Tistrella sp.]MAD37351.1 nitrate reductase molybdenum cofactor assembly chaperone [Tistrella sp.]MBA78006.1 nitrate reductase molybdenum cofactor assembly chaperone [Tistrella sp.]